jgi:hypothetical protein
LSAFRSKEPFAERRQCAKSRTSNLKKLFIYMAWFKHKISNLD